LGLLESDTPARHLKMKIGGSPALEQKLPRRGLSQGFIGTLGSEPRLLFIQQTAATFVAFLEQGDLGDAAQAKFNARVQRALRGTRGLHRHPLQDQQPHRIPEYWRAKCGKSHLSEPLKQLLSYGMSGRGIAPPVRQQALQGLPRVFLVLHHGRHGYLSGSTTLRAPTRVRKLSTG